MIEPTIRLRKKVGSGESHSPGSSAADYLYSPIQPCLQVVAPAIRPDETKVLLAGTTQTDGRLNFELKGDRISYLVEFLTMEKSEINPFPGQ